MSGVQQQQQQQQQQLYKCGVLGVLPDEIIIGILLFLSPTELCRICSVNLRLFWLSSSEIVWKIICERWPVIPSRRSINELLKDVNFVDEQQKLIKRFAKSYFVIETVGNRAVENDLFLKRLFVQHFMHNEDKCVLRLLEIPRSAIEFPGEYSTKLVIRGEVGVGKSALTVQYIQRIFIIEYDPMLEDSYRKIDKINGQRVFMELLDTAGNEDYQALRDQSRRLADGFVLVYSVTDRRSLEYISRIADGIARCKERAIHEVPIVLVGNKIDLAEDRQVSFMEGAMLAETLGASFFETSAKTGFNVDECIRELNFLVAYAKSASRSSSSSSSKKKRHYCIIS